MPVAALITLVAGAALAVPAPSEAAVTAPTTTGYSLLLGIGGVYNFGTRFLGVPSDLNPDNCAPSPLPGRAPQPFGTCQAMASTPDGNGYWIMNSVTGAIFSFGNAHDFGSPQAKFADVSPEFRPVMKQIVSTADGKGYWVYEIGASDTGTIDHFGDAGFFGDTTTLAVHSQTGFNGRPVGIAATADGKGYWEVHSDGGVFAFGDARFVGSMAARPLAAPIVSIVATATGKGYWLVASDGGVFAFGDARFVGSMAGRPHAPIIGMARNPAGSGYWLAGVDGGVFAFGGAAFLGSLAVARVPIYAIVAKTGPTAP